MSKNVEIKNKITVRKDQKMFEEKYRPSTIDECILPAKDKKALKALISDKSIPNIILYSREPGTGKTTVARAMCEEIGIDYLFLNGSDVTIDVIRNQVQTFATTASSLDAKVAGKVIILDEFDRKRLKDAQELLRSFMNVYSNNCTFIITANNIDNIIPAIKDRCRKIHFGHPSAADKKAMTRAMLARAEAICKNEDFEVDRKVLVQFIYERVPNFRNITQTIDFYTKSSGGVIDEGLLSATGLSVETETGGIIDKIIEGIRDKNLTHLRSLTNAFTLDYGNNLRMLMDKLYPQVTNASKLTAIELCYENGKSAPGIDPDIHAWGLFTMLIINMVFL